jgi:hypothetical protein
MTLYWGGPDRELLNAVEQPPTLSKLGMTQMTEPSNPSSRCLRLVIPVNAIVEKHETFVENGSAEQT